MAGPLVAPDDRAPFWVRAGDAARVLIRGGQIALVVYWESSLVNVDEPIPCTGFYWFAPGDPSNHFFLQEAEEITSNGWDTACELASREHYDPMHHRYGEREH